MQLFPQSSFLIAEESNVIFLAQSFPEHLLPAAHLQGLNISVMHYTAPYEPRPTSISKNPLTLSVTFFRGTPYTARVYLCRVKLIVLEKPVGSIHPIAVGENLRHEVSAKFFVTTHSTCPESCFVPSKKSRHAVGFRGSDSLSQHDCVRTFKSVWLSTQYSCHRTYLQQDLSRDIAINFNWKYCFNADSFVSGFQSFLTVKI